MIIQRIWAFLIGAVSTVIGVLGFLSVADIPLRDAVIHVISGLLYLIGAGLRGGRYVRFFNILLGIFYMGFGALYSNWAHSIAGVVSCLVGLLFRGKEMKLTV
jgi:hypothetical protein